MQNHKTWILIADASKARIFSLHKALIFQEQNPNSLELIGNFSHEESRLKNSELETDKMGSYLKGRYQEETPAKAHEADMFALQLTKELNQGRNESHFRDVILVAPPTFMGYLHKHIQAHNLEKLVTQTIEKNYTQDEGQTLVKHLLSHF